MHFRIRSNTSGLPQMTGLWSYADARHWRDVMLTAIAKRNLDSRDLTIQVCLPVGDGKRTIWLDCQTFVMFANEITEGESSDNGGLTALGNCKP